MTQKEIILKDKFLKIKDINDLANLLNEITFGNLPHKKLKITTKHLRYFLYKSKSSYTTYSIPKKRKGQSRIVKAPTKGLKVILRKINYCLQLTFTPRSAAHGFIPLKSIVTNARQHVGKKYIFNIDLENFFPSIQFGRVRAVFKLAPFNFSNDVSTLLANLCCHNGYLPQGAPTSPIISNIVSQRLDSKLVKLAIKFKSRYSRYADDITFSSSKNPFKKKKFLDSVNQIILDEGFKINNKKTRLLSWRDRQIVTGLVVNEKLNVQKKYIRSIRLFLNAWEKHSEEYAESIFKVDYIKKGNAKKYEGKVPKMRNVLHGKLQFLKMVKGENDDVYKNLLKKYDQLILGKDELKENIDDQIQDLEKEIRSLFRKFNSSSKYQKDTILININDKLFELKNLVGEKNNLFLILRKELFQKAGTLSNSNILKNNLNKFNQPFSNFPYSKKIRETSITHIHNPLYTPFFLEKFQDKNSGFRNIVHSNNNKIFLAELRKARKELFEDKNKKIQRDLYFYIFDFLKYLIKEEERTGQNLTSSDAFNKHKDAITSFKRIYRFGGSLEETNLKESIYLIIEKINGFQQKFWRVEFPDDSEFNIETLTNTVEILNGIEIILRNFKDKSNGKGIIRFRIRKKCNRTILEIIDVGSICKKEFDKLIHGGNNGILKDTLNSLCDISILTEYEKEFYEIPLLSYNNKKLKTFETNIEGFTYQLIFYNPPKILLVDDDDSGRLDDQIQILKELIPDYNKFLIAKTEIINIKELDSYNLLLLHKSYDKPLGYPELKKTALEYNLPVVSFGGGIPAFKKSGNEYFIPADLMYKNLEGIIKEIKKNQKVEVSFLESEKGNKKSNLKEIKKEILQTIIKNNLEYPKLSPKIFGLLKNFIPNENEIPSIKNKKQLLHIIDSFIFD